MTTAEFDRWLDDLEIRFPSVSTWFAKHAQDDDSRRKMLRSWCSVLGDVSLADCLYVNQQMQAGDLPWVGEYDNDKERLPQHVRRLAKQFAFDTRREPEDAEPPHEFRPSDFPAGKILVRMQQLVRAGLEYDEARTKALEEFPIGTSTNEPRYRCRTCLDQQLVEVASPAAIRAMIGDRFAECRHRSGMMRCHCDTRKPSDKFKQATYNPELDFKIEDHLWRPAEVQRLRAWVEWHRQNSAEARARANPNYDRGFAEWNNR